MGTHPIFESDFDCLTEMEVGHPIIDVPELPKTCPFESVPIVACESPEDKSFDAFVLVGQFSAASDFKAAGDEFVKTAELGTKVNTALFERGASLLASPSGNRVVISSVGSLDRCEDDVRRYFDAAFDAVQCAVKAGSKKPLLLIFPGAVYKNSLVVSILGGAKALYTNYELRLIGKEHKADTLGVWADTKSDITSLVNVAAVVEESKIACRDLLGSDPETMNPKNFTEYCEKLFGDLETSSVMYSSISGAEQILKEYPCMAAVDRACKHIERHRARAIWLDYTDGKPERTIVLIGKGLTYDTGGADIKAGGSMAGMHRDKGGASAAAGFMHAVNRLKPKNIKIVAGLAVCRNSVGSEAYLPDEIITARSGKRLRIGNTDAEGRMAMVDLLCQAKERSIKEKWNNPVFHTIATLTGHALIAVGPYSAIVANGPARKAGLDLALAEAGQEIGDCFDVSTLRREDFIFHTGKDEQSDIYQATPGPSTRSPRGHQGPAAFLMMASGLHDHGSHADLQLPYCHLDIAGSSGPFPGIATGAPIVGLLQHYKLI